MFLVFIEVFVGKLVFMYNFLFYCMFYQKIQFLFLKESVLDYMFIFFFFDFIQFEECRGGNEKEL